MEVQLLYSPVCVRVLSLLAVVYKKKKKISDKNVSSSDNTYCIIQLIIIIIGFCITCNMETLSSLIVLILMPGPLYAVTRRKEEETLIKCSQ